MKTFRSQSQPEQRGALSSLSSLSSSAMSPLSTASITLAVLFILTIPACTSAPANLQQASTDQIELLRQIDAVCSSYLSADLKYWTSDIIGELCILMLVQKSKELRVQEDSKRFLFQYSRPQGSVLSHGVTSQLHPLLHLVSQLHPRRERGVVMSAELQGPGGIESRGYFLYRPRNGRRSLEYE
ncbi:neuromedin-U isoform X1 [Fundulus heteroclitus]|uniref:neuromedin-U isoform X1 n=1 Tax=Fundulus heteroclitus TaxID=8078 RepID=UPI000644F5AC|nr:neuromedin-U isoform X1 [Fundulus heteroclitus]XP_035997369.1 neuromedin-U isoform X1 [Fundulus heteroclitus]